MSEPPRFNWPNRGDKAFAFSGQPADHSVVAAFVFPSTGGYAVGFKQAADTIVDACGENEDSPDLLFFPVAYLYRHSLELTLKDIIRLGIRSGAITAPKGVLEKLLQGHSLHCLWKLTREAIMAVWPEGDHKDTLAVEQIILEFHRLDKSGQAFRYPTDKSGRRHFEKGPKCISLKNMQQVFGAVDCYLDAAYVGIEYSDPGDLM